MSLTSQYLKLITSQHRSKPKYAQLLSSLFAHSEDIFDLGTIFDDNFNVEVAEGVQLDTIGSILGQSRILENGYGLNDEEYRVILLAKSVKNHWKGTKPELIKALKFIFPGKQILIKDNQDMTMGVFLEGKFTEAEYNMILRGHVI